MAGYSGTPLLKKLGIKPGIRIYVHQPPPSYFDWLHPLPEKTEVAEKAGGRLDFIHLFVKDQKTFRDVLIKSKTSFEHWGHFVSTPFISDTVADRKSVV